MSLNSNISFTIKVLKLNFKKGFVMQKSAKQKEEESYKRLKLLFPTEEIMLDGLATAIGMSATLCQFVHDFSKEFECVEHLPTMVKYAMAVTSANMVAITSANPDGEIEVFKFPVIEHLEDEQYEEHLHRKMCMIIEFLYNSIKREAHNG